MIDNYNKRMNVEICIEKTNHLSFANEYNLQLSIPPQKKLVEKRIHIINQKDEQYGVITAPIPAPTFTITIRI